MTNKELEELEREVRLLFASSTGQRMDQDQREEVERVIREAYKLGVRAAFKGYETP